MISAYIFSGPTLHPFLIKEQLGYELNDRQELILESGKIIKFMPPVSEGDILKIISHNPQVIGIIDGYFETMPSVWHKEILYAMSKGIHVVGASSMGALRAAELSAFGMEGIGSIYKAFSDGYLEDDDEVTVIHGPNDMGFPLLSEAMVNIRRTFDDAYAQKIISAMQREQLIFIAKNLNYKSRNYRAIITQVKEQYEDLAFLEKFEKWLKEGRKDQKAIDAILLVTDIIEKINKSIKPKEIRYNFENTVIWMRSRTTPKEMDSAT